MRFGYADTAMGQVHYRRMGQGAPLLLLGSSGRSSSIFEPLLPLLAPHVDAIALDTPGFGQSCALPLGATIEQLAECAAAVLDDLGIGRCHIYGLHTGNKIATAFAGRWPQRVDQLVLAGQSHSLIPDRTRRNETILAIVQEYFQEDVPAPFTEIADWAAVFARLSAVWWDPPAAGRRRRCGGTADGAEHGAGMSCSRRGQPPSTAPISPMISGPATPPSRRRPRCWRSSRLKRTALWAGRRPPVAALIPGRAALRTIAEPRGHTLTLENRAPDLAAILLAALRPEATTS